MRDGLGKVIGVEEARTETVLVVSGGDVLVSIQVLNLFPRVVTVQAEGDDRKQTVMFLLSTMKDARGFT